MNSRCLVLNAIPVSPLLSPDGHSSIAVGANDDTDRSKIYRKPSEEVVAKTSGRFGLNLADVSDDDVDDNPFVPGGGAGSH